MNFTIEPDAAALRRKAEELLKNKKAVVNSELSDAEVLKLVHELEVHQFELEMQNQELQLARSAAKEAFGEYQELYDFAPSGYITLSATGEIQKLNYAAARMLGKERGRLIKSDFRFFVSEKTLPAFNEFLAGAFLSGSRTTGVAELVRTGMPSLFVHLEGMVPESHEECFATIIDVTANRIAEDALRESEEHFRTVTQSANDAIITINEKGIIIGWNNGAEKIFGYSPEEITGQELVRIVPKSYAASHPQHIRRVANGGERHIIGKTVELEGLHKNGKQFPIELSLSDWKSANDIFFTGIIRDITQRKKAEAAIKEINERLRIALLASKAGAWDWNMVDNTFFWSDEFLTLFGLPADTVAGMESWKKSMHPDDFEPAVRRLSDSITDRTDLINDYRIILPDNQIRWIRSVGKTYYSGDTPIRMLGLCFDITGQKESEIELVRAKEKAEESDRLKSAFLANMSHEIRTPMNGILGFAEMLKEPGIDEKDHQKYISIIEKSGIRLLNIINNIINLSKIESGLIEIHISETNLNTLSEHLFTFFKPEAEQKGLDLILRNNGAGSNVIISTDQEKIYAILTNLIKNAIKFTQKGTVEFGFEKNASFIRFFVRDTGNGIPVTQKDIIFERFRQGSESLSRNYEGAGLGLAISKAFVGLLGGEIRVESEVDKGSVFYFTIPCT